MSDDDNDEIRDDDRPKIETLSKKKKSAKRAKLMTLEERRKSSSAIFLPLQRPALLGWVQTMRIFDPRNVHKMPSPNQSKTTKNLGDGVVALKRFAKGAVVCSYGGKVLSAEEHRALVAQHDYRCPRVAYFIDLVPDAWLLDGHPSNIESRYHVGQFLNDARGLEGCETNCFIEIDATRDEDSLFTVLIKTTRDINPGEELFISYGEGDEKKEGYWNVDESLLGKCDCKCLN